MCSFFSCHSSLLITLAWSTGGCWFKLMSWAVDNRDWGVGTHSISRIYGAVTSKNHLAVNRKFLSLGDWRLNEYREEITMEVSVLGINMTSICHTATTAKLLFWSLLLPDNNAHLLNRLKRAGRGLRSGWPKPFLPLIIVACNVLTEILLVNRKRNESEISLHVVKGKIFPFPQNCRPASFFSWTRIAVASPSSCRSIRLSV